MSSLGFSLKTQTRLAASPHLQQAVHLLQLSALEFTQELQQALATNPFLEEVEEIEENAELGDDESPDSDSSDLDAHLDGDPDACEIAAAPAGEDSVSDSFDALSEREEQRDPFDGYDGHEGSASSTLGTPATDPFEWVRQDTSLREHLLQQICGRGVSQRQQMAAAVVIDSLEDDGYLRSDVREAADATGIEPALDDAEIEHAIRFVQGFDPAGVGARDLSECLALQLAALDDDATAVRDLALSIVRDHLDTLAGRRYAALRQALSCDDDALNQAVSLIRRLDPRPGLRFTSQRPEYVVPDVIVREQGRELSVLINPASRPGARLNSSYVQWFRAAKHQEHPALSQQLQEARWLMHSVEQRYSTIQRVAEVIVRRQRGFFVGGEIALKPLVLREVADELGIHESTVSRATSNKYMQTPRGLFEFRHFFSRKLATETGGSCSAASVRALMTQMLADEQAPKSDVALARMLGENGVQISRRTVTKYRNLMKVAPVELRRRA